MLMLAIVVVCDCPWEASCYQFGRLYLTDPSAFARTFDYDDVLIAF